MSLSTQPKMQRKEFGSSRGGMVSGMILKSLAAFKEKRRSNSTWDVMLQSGRYRKKTLRNELQRNLVSGSCLFMEACRCKGNILL